MILMNEKIYSTPRESLATSEPAPGAPERPAPPYSKPRLVPHGQLKPAGFLLGSPPDPP